MDRVTRLVKYYAENKQSRPEGRGGVRNSQQKAIVCQSIKDHITKFTSKERHYSRKKIPGKNSSPVIYLSKRCTRFIYRRTNLMFHTNFILLYFIVTLILALVEPLVIFVLRVCLLSIN